MAAKYWLIQQTFLVLLLLVSLFSIVYVSRPTRHEEFLEVNKKLRRDFILDERDDILQQIKKLVKDYQSNKLPVLVKPLDPLNNEPIKPERWELPENFSISATLATPHKERTKTKYAQNKFVNIKESKSTPGYLNVHFWDSFCGSRIEDLKRNIHFPYYPAEIGSISKFFLQRYETGYGQRIFGFIHPPETGEFKFAVSCDDNCEVWLSTNEDPENIIKITSIGTFEDPSNTKIADFQAYPSQISKGILLKKDRKYYIELIHKQGAYKDHVLLTWIAPSWSRIRTINAKDISSFIDTKSDMHDVNEYKFLVPVTKACQGLEKMDFTNSIYHYNRTKNSFTRYDYREDFFKMKTVDMVDFQHILPLIKYKPSYVLDFMPDRYEGVRLMHESSIYPNDFTELTHMTSYMDCKKPRVTDSHFHYLDGFEPDEGTEDEMDDLVKEKEFSDYLENQPEAIKKALKDNLFKKKLSSRKSHQMAKPIISNFSSRKLMALGANFESNKNNKKTLIKEEDDIEKRRQSILEKIKFGKALQLSGHDDSNSPATEDQKSSRDSPTGNSRYDSYQKYGRRYNRRFKRRKLRVYKNKVFFKDGKIENFNTSKGVDGKALMIHYHPLFGTAIYYLATSPGRSFLWKYKTFLSKCKNEGNLPLYSGVGIGVVHKYMQAVKNKHGSKYELRRIVNVEENHDVINGDRYLIEIELAVKDKGLPQRLSTYIYRDAKHNKLYKPKGFSLNPKATVHVIVPVKNQGRWVQHFIDNMEKIYLETNDENLNVIIVDFNSTDIDIGKSLMRSKLKRYNFVPLGGSFERAFGLQAGADLIKDENDIIFTCDLHLDIPSILIDTIRKHTIKKKLGFAPLVHRLSCGYTPDLPYGLWETDGYGLFSISKYDFDRIGGMNTKEFKTKWGGEDWEFLDRVLGHGLEVERLRVPNFFHHYHSRKKMWQSGTASKTSSSTTTTRTPLRRKLFPE